MAEKVSPDIRICQIIYEYNERGEPLWFSKLVEVSKMSKIDVSKIEDKLYDLYIIDKAYVETLEGCFASCYKLNEDIKWLIKKTLGKEKQ